MTTASRGLVLSCVAVAALIVLPAPRSLAADRALSRGSAASKDEGAADRALSRGSAASKDGSAASRASSRLNAAPKSAKKPRRPHPALIEDQRVKPPEVLPAELKPPEQPRIPWLVRWMIRPIRNGMFVNLPIVDTNPNRGVTYGVMPIWVFHGQDDPRIRHIHAPSVTYNTNFNWIPTYRYYYYPTSLSSYQFRTSISKNQDRELMGQMTDTDFLDRSIAFNAKVQYDVDGSKRFFGIGPDTPESDETNFTRKIAHYYARVGVPFLQDTGLRWNVAHHLSGETIREGVIGDLPSIGAKFPQEVPAGWRQDSELQLFVDYDTRDNDVTTSRGSYVKFMIENSQKAFASAFTFQRYGIDLRHFYKPSDEARRATAGRFLYDQLVGGAPFYLLPSLGGKYIHRGYGEGRYIDKGMMTASIEERFTVYDIKVTGVTTEIEIAPFAELGTVFNCPKRLARKYLRPVIGSAFRAIARPQVVGSVDVGVGQEGAAVFMDINYSF